MSNKKNVNREYLEKLVLEVRRFGSHTLLERDFTQIGGTLGVAEPLYQDAMDAIKKGDTARAQRSIEAVKEIGNGQAKIAAAVLSFFATWSGLAAAGEFAFGTSAGQAASAALKTPLGKSLALTATTYYGGGGSKFWNNVYDLTSNYGKTFLAQASRSIQGGQTNQALKRTSFPSEYKNYEKTIKSFFSLYSKDNWGIFTCDTSNRKHAGLPCHPSQNYTHKTVKDSVLNLLVGGSSKEIDPEFWKIPNPKAYFNVYKKLSRALSSSGFDVIKPKQARRLSVLASDEKVSRNVYALLCLSFIYENMDTTRQTGTSDWFKSCSDIISGYIDKPISPDSEKNEEDVEDVFEQRNPSLTVEGPPIGFEKRAPSKTNLSSRSGVINLFETIKTKTMNAKFENEEFRRAYKLFYYVLKTDSANSILDMASIEKCLEEWSKMIKKPNLAANADAKRTESKFSMGEEFVSFMIFTSPENIPIEWTLKSTGAILSRITSAISPSTGSAVVRAAQARSWVGIVLSLTILTGFYFLDPFNRVQRGKIIKILDEAIKKLQEGKREAQKVSGSGKWYIPKDKASGIMNTYYKALESLSEELSEAVDLTWSKESSVSSDVCETLRNRLIYVEKMTELNLKVKTALEKLSDSEVTINDANYDKVENSLKDARLVITKSFDKFKTPDTSIMVKEEKTKTENPLLRYIESNTNQVLVESPQIDPAAGAPQDPQSSDEASPDGEGPLEVPVEVDWVNLFGDCENLAEQILKSMDTSLAGAGKKRLNKALASPKIYSERLSKIENIDYGKERVFGIMANRKFMNENQRFFTIKEPASAGRTDNKGGMLFQGSYSGLKFGRIDCNLIGIPAASGVDGICNTSNAWGTVVKDFGFKSERKYSSVYKTLNNISNLSLEDSFKIISEIWEKPPEQVGDYLKLKKLSTQKEASMQVIDKENGVFKVLSGMIAETPNILRIESVIVELTNELERKDLKQETRDKYSMYFSLFNVWVKYRKLLIEAESLLSKIYDSPITIDENIVKSLFKKNEITIDVQKDCANNKNSKKGRLFDNDIEKVNSKRIAEQSSNISNLFFRIDKILSLDQRLNEIFN